MAWLTENRRTAVVEKGEAPYLTDAMKEHLRTVYFPRYPTKRAVLLPALHLLQHQYNWLPTAALEEVAGFLEIAPAEVLDTATFYEEYWLKPKGKYLVGVCRSLACEICQSEKITDHLRNKFNIEPMETTADGRFTLIEMECIGSCGTAPAMLVNEVLKENLTIESVDQIIDSLPADPHDYKDPTVTWDEHGGQ
jgi:NADH-quinone oxidoreductase subunit E